MSHGGLRAGPLAPGTMADWATLAKSWLEGKHFFSSSNGALKREKNRGQCEYFCVAKMSTSASSKRLQISSIIWGCSLYSPWTTPSLDSVSTPQFNLPSMWTAQMEIRSGLPMQRVPQPRSDASIGKTFLLTTLPCNDRIRLLKFHSLQKASDQAPGSEALGSVYSWFRDLNRNQSDLSFAASTWALEYHL